MGDVIHSMGMSVDGYVEDASGDFQFATPGDDLHELSNQLMRDAAAMVFGRGVYELMTIWDQWATEEGHPPVIADFAAAYAATPVYLVSDTAKPDGRATIVPRAEARALVERLRETEDGLIEVSGPTLVGSLIDLVDEFRVWVAPVALGGGKPFFPQGLPEHLRLTLEECRVCDGGKIYLRYRRE